MPPAHPPRLSADILDAITDAVMACVGPTNRTEVLAAVIEEFRESVIWLHTDSASAEMVSLDRVVQAIDAHRARMRGLADIDSDRVAS